MPKDAAIWGARVGTSNMPALPSTCTQVVAASTSLPMARSAAALGDGGTADLGMDRLPDYRDGHGKLDSKIHV
jgi:hypothetical protein